MCWPTIIKWEHHYPFHPRRKGRISVDGDVCGPTANPDRPPAGDYQYRRREEAWALDERVYWSRKPTIRWNIHVVDFYEVVAMGIFVPRR